MGHIYKVHLGLFKLLDGSHQQTTRYFLKKSSSNKLYLHCISKISCYTYILFSLKFNHTFTHHIFSFYLKHKNESISL